MAYEECFRHADGVVACLSRYVPSVSDQLDVVRLSGFVAVAAVTAYEQAIKNIFVDFAMRRDQVFGEYVRSYFDKINGRIKYAELKDEYTRRFGENYRNSFKNNVGAAVKEYLRECGRDPVTAYGNIVTWRNAFAHEGILSSTATFNEVVTTYSDGKVIILCLARSMMPAD